MDVLKEVGGLGILAWIGTYLIGNPLQAYELGWYTQIAGGIILAVVVIFAVRMIYIEQETKMGSEDYLRRQRIKNPQPLVRPYTNKKR